MSVRLCALFSIFVIFLALSCGTEDASKDTLAPAGDTIDTVGQDVAGVDAKQGEDATPGDTAPGQDTVPGEDTAPGEDTTGGQVFTPPSADTTYIYRVGGAGPEGAAADLPAKYGPKETYNGHEYRRMEVGDFTVADPIGVKIWALYENDTLQTGGAEVYNPGTDGKPSFAYLFDEPLLGNLNGEIDVPQVTETTGKFKIGETELPFAITLTYTLKSKNASVTVPAGTFEGCIHYEIIEDSTDLQGFKAEYWLKSGIGMIKATVIPGFDALELVSYSLPD